MNYSKVIIFTALPATLATFSLVLGGSAISKLMREVILAGNVVSNLASVQKKSVAKQTDSRSSSPIFVEVADQAGLEFQYYNGMTGQLYLPEIMGSGAALLDFDNDGDLDILIVQGSVIDPKSRPDNTLFRGGEMARRGRGFTETIWQPAKTARRN